MTKTPLDRPIEVCHASDDLSPSRHPEGRAIPVNASTVDREGFTSLLSAIDTVNQYEKAPEACVQWLKKRITLGSSFPWSPVLYTAKDKATGRHRSLGDGELPVPGERLIGRLKTPDSLLVKALSLLLSEKLDPGFSNDSYAYRRGGRNQVTALRTFYEEVFTTRRSTFVAKLDVRDFFGSIPHEKLLALLNAQGLPSLWTELIEGFLRHSSKKGVLQGSPLSGVLSNLYLHSFDQALEAAGVKFLRYADDITLLSQSEAQLSKCIQIAQKELGKRGLTLNEGKTLYFSHSSTQGDYLPLQPSFELLGFQFHSDGTYAIREKTLERARQKIRRLFHSVMTLHPHRSPAAQLNEAIHRFHCFLGYERPKASDRVPPYRLSRPKRTGLYGWVRYWAALPHSERIDQQLQILQREAACALRPYARRLKSHLRSTVSAYRTLAPTADGREFHARRT